METREEWEARLRKEIEKLKAELRDRQEALPAHSIRPHQLQAIEDLEEKIHLLEKEFSLLPF
jgi:hypothetical protein